MSCTVNSLLPFPDSSCFTQEYCYYSISHIQLWQSSLWWELHHTNYTNLSGTSFSDWKSVDCRWYCVGLWAFMLQFFSSATCYKDCFLCALGSSGKAFPMLNYSVRAFLRIVLLFWRIKGWETELDVSVVSAHSQSSNPNHIQALLLKTF